MRRACDSGRCSRPSRNRISRHPAGDQSVGAVLTFLPLHVTFRRSASLSWRRCWPALPPRRSCAWKSRTDWSRIVATDTPLRQILAEWAKVGGTRIVNAERVAGPPVTLQLQQVPEQQALAVLLRSVAGYLAAPRRAGGAGASHYESVMILATSTPSGTPAPPAAAARGPVNPLIRPIPPQMEMLGQQQEMPDDGGPDRVGAASSPSAARRRRGSRRPRGRGRRATPMGSAVSSGLPDAAGMRDRRTAQRRRRHPSTVSRASCCRSRLIAAIPNARARAQSRFSSTERSFPGSGSRSDRTRP